MINLPRLILMTFVLLPLGASRSAIASEMPAHAPEILEQILLADEFQPREQDEQWWDILWKKFLPYIEEIVDRAGRLFEQLADIKPGSIPIPDWLHSITSAVTHVFLFSAAVFVFLALGFLIYRMVLPYIKLRGTNKQQDTGEDDLLTAQQLPDLDALAQAGQVRELLAGLRLTLRQQFALEHGTPPSLTDRETHRALPGEERFREVFSEIVRLFERVAFAGQSEDAEEVNELYQRYRN